MICTIAAGFLLSSYGASGQAVSGVTYKVVQMGTNWVFFGQSTNIPAANGLVTTGQLEAAAAPLMATGQAAQAAADAAMATGMAARAQADLALATGVTAVATIAGHMMTTNPHAVTPSMIGAATIAQGELAETSVQSTGRVYVSNWILSGTDDIPADIEIRAGQDITRNNNIVLTSILGGYPGQFGQVVFRFLQQFDGTTNDVASVTSDGFCGPGSGLSNIPPSAVGATWRTNTVITEIYTNDVGVVTGKVYDTIIYLGLP